jgi:ACR3 family arsenite efflux pump ArsB
MGATVEVNFFKVVQQIAIIVFLPMALGYMTRQALLKKYTMPVFKEQIAPRFPAISTIGVLGIVFVAMSLKAETILADPGQLMMIFVPLVILYLFNFTLSTIAGRSLFNRGDGIALVYGTVMRNLSIALAIAINAFGPEGADAALVIALAYVIQVQSAAWYVKFSDKFFGRLPAAGNA